MAQIFDTARFIWPANVAGVSTITKNNADTLIRNYWGNVLVGIERLFPITYTQLDSLFASSGTNEAALHVKNISSTANMQANWIPFNSANRPALLADGTTDFYFILNSNNFNNNPGGPILSIRRSGNSHNNIICARLARQNPGAGNYAVVFWCTSLSFPAGPVGGGGATRGAKVPS